MSISCSTCQFYTHHAIFSPLEGELVEVSKKLVRAGFHPISPVGPVKTSFQVDIDIYKDKLCQSGDRIISSHITKIIIFFLITQPSLVITAQMKGINTRHVLE